MVHSRVSSGRNEVETCVNTVILELRITLDARLFSKDIIVLAFKVIDYFLETR